MTKNFDAAELFERWASKQATAMLRKSKLGHSQVFSLLDRAVFMLARDDSEPLMQRLIVHVGDEDISYEGDRLTAIIDYWKAHRVDEDQRKALGLPEHQPSTPMVDDER
jgi:hypothetical protein